MYVVRNGVKQELSNVNDLVNGDNLVLDGTDDISRIKFVRQREIEQPRNARYNDEAAGESIPTATQLQFSVLGRVFTLTGAGLLDMAQSLLATINKKAKKEERVKKVMLISSDYHPNLLDADGNIVWEDDANTIPAKNEKITQHSFTFDGLVTADEINADRDEELTYKAKEAQITGVSEKALEAMFRKFANVPALQD